MAAIADRPQAPGVEAGGRLRLQTRHSGVNVSEAIPLPRGRVDTQQLAQDQGIGTAVGDDHHPPVVHTVPEVEVTTGLDDPSLRQRLLEAARYPPVEIPEALRSEEHTSELQSRENLVCRL